MSEELKGKKSSKGDAIRKNQNKLRYDLIQPDALDDMVKVLTMGAEKYYDRNWENGFSWSSVLGSLKRHIAAFEMGEDYDPESGELHIAHAASNVHFLNAYYHIFPQGDDRPKKYLKPPRIGLDLDGVLADFFLGWHDLYPEIPLKPKHWRFDRKMNQRFKELEANDVLNEFYFNLKPLITSDELHFEPCCYITNRWIPNEINERWLDKHKFPAVPVISVGVNGSKADVAKKMNVDIFIDDSYDNFVDLNNKGIFTYLYDASYNEKYDVGHMRLNSLKELPIFKK